MVYPRCVWLILAVGLLSAMAWEGRAQTITLTNTGQCEVKGHLSYLRDDTDTVSLQGIQHARMQRLPDPYRSPSFGFDRASYWFRFEVTNQSNRTEWLMEIPYAPLDRVDIYTQPTGAKQWTHKVDGDIFPIAAREIQHRHILFRLSIPRGETQTVYLKVKTISSVQLPLIISTPDRFQVSSSQTHIINGFFYGAMLVMILYQLFLFVSMRDRTTFYYVLTLIAMANVISFFQGYTFLFLYPSTPVLNNHFAELSGPLFILCSALLTRSFLNLPRFSRTLDILLIANTAIDWVLALVMMFSDDFISFKYHHLFTSGHCLIVLTSAGYCLYRKYKPAFYYLMAWVTLLLAAVAFTMGNLGMAPGYLGTNYQGLMIGCVLQVLLISFALGERYNILVRENEAAKELELKRGQEENERLESEVQARTEEIREQNSKLEELNRIKDKLFSVVSHDIKAPLTSLKLSLVLTKLGRLSPEEFKDLSAEIETHLDQTTNFIQNLLQWAKFQLGGESVRPKKLELTKLIDETVALLEADFRQKFIRLNQDVAPDVTVFADPVMIQSVIRNLLTNALKFTPLCGTIILKGTRSEKEITISITDSGTGIPKTNRHKLFTLESLTTPGTQQETGTGLGLVLCKEFVEKNNGRIWFDCVDGEGTTFYFSLPLHVSELKHA